MLFCGSVADAKISDFLRWC